MAAPAPSPALAGSSPLCNRCKEQPATADLRGEQVCKTCFAQFLLSKAVKRLEVLQRELRGPRLPATGRPPRYLVGVSGGPSSAALLHMLVSNLSQHRARGQRPRFEILAVHVATSSDTDTDTDALLSRYRARFPGTPVRAESLSAVLDDPGIDWGALPTADADPDADPDPDRRLETVLSRLPSATSRADVSRLLVRHALLAAAAREQCDVLLLGYNTTALAELTLAETAKGRGFALPWLVNDGAFPAPRRLDDVDGISSSSVSADAQTTAAAEEGRRRRSKATIPVYSPLRELFRKELLTYVANTEPPLTELLVDDGGPPLTNGNGNGNGCGNGAVVSHRDLSIDDVMARYFADVEVNYPSVVANVVRTTGKLARLNDGGDNDWCSLCGVALDELGDERWRGEIGEGIEAMAEGDARGKRKLCYGCERSVRG
ncbi:hypothetical protein F4779DRAFT_562096 [Xylariaceae sp. FL0662B]|nr:hypothetical protein F4779DRAFT_562096 [Xylariaceae sp. FL0662B]